MNGFARLAGLGLLGLCIMASGCALSSQVIVPPTFPDVNYESPSNGPALSDETVETVAPGKVIVFDCGSVNPSIGTDWNVDDGYDSSIVKVTKKMSWSGGGSGSGGHLKFEIVGLVVGQTTVTFIYYWRLSTVIGSYTMTVSVTG